MVVDVIGTLDECRFTFNGVHVSKEVARQFYKKTAWYKDLEQAKKDAEAKGSKTGKPYANPAPKARRETQKSHQPNVHVSRKRDDRQTILQLAKLSKVIATTKRLWVKKHEYGRQNQTILIDGYNPEKIRIGVLGSHSALEIASAPNRKDSKPSSSAKTVEKKPTPDTTETSLTNSFSSTNSAT